MRIIAHRGNTYGPNPQTENKPETIRKAIDLGFDCEVDVWFSNGSYFLGHDCPESEIPYSFLEMYCERLWIHCKHLDSLVRLKDTFNCFYHDKEIYTLTSRGFIWGNINSPCHSLAVQVMPEKSDVFSSNCFGVCTDYPVRYARRLDCVFPDAVQPTMRIARHLTFYFLSERIRYINDIIDETNGYDYPTDVFIHTNDFDLKENMFHPYTNGRIEIVHHDITNIYPYYLTWKCRDLLKEQRDDYDVFMYCEGDISVPRKALQYWLDTNESLIEKNYNVGFIRVELENGVEYSTDLLGEHMDTLMELDGRTYCVNNKNPYCAFWIYNKNEFNKFVDSKYYDISAIPDYGIPEKSAVGLHGFGTGWYTHTIIPMIGDKLIEDCKIYHLPNNFVENKSTLFGTIRFDEIVQLPC